LNKQNQSQRVEALVSLFLNKTKARARPRLIYSNKAKASAGLEVRFICKEKT